jgi:hypothetical protein
MRDLKYHPEWIERVGVRASGERAKSTTSEKGTKKRDSHPSLASGCEGNVDESSVLDYQYGAGGL